MDASAMYLVHKCSAEFFEWGNLNADQLAAFRDNCEAAIRDLNKLDNNVASMYASKCSKPQADLLNLMKEGGWLNAKEACEWGFVDEITDMGETKPVLTDAVASAMAAAGIPIPNVPAADKETAFARFLAAISSLFKNKNDDSVNHTEITKTQALMNQFLPLLGKALNIEGFAVGENGCTLTLEQLKSVEAALSGKDQRIAELADELAAVKQSPGDTSTAVINEGKQDTPQPQDEVASFAQTCSSAQQLFNQLP